MIEVTLGTYEKTIAKAMARGRNIVSMRATANRRRDGDQADEVMHIETVGAEFALAKALNIFPDLSVREGRVPAHDLVLNDYRLQVKRRQSGGEELLVPTLDEKVVYVLVHGRMPNYTVAGYLPGADVARLGTWTALTKGPCWVVEVSHLRPIEDFMGGRQSALEV